ncbi:Endoplasmic reticulum transmembrane protein 3 [Dispira parvispora]|uniref:Endoplasmic reticulum transmembrane protein n=1 Tax=Dispira parvispora TaxID=1520584 RepID=A0A9W8AQL6_9FUNG|nr:Endoplasmic reticulum transmembrane protein 3 [Dispira parvispora]
MALHYTLIFALLIFELPLPHQWRRNFLYVISRSRWVASGFYWIRVVYVFVFLLFLDAVVRMQKTENELRTEPIADARMESQLHARKFYSQRNVYLTGFTLFLGLILSGTYHLVLDLLKREDEMEATNRVVSDKSKQETTSRHDEVKKLRQDLSNMQSELTEARKQVVDFENLRKQAEGQHQEYMRLADRYNALEKQSIADKKGD